MKKHFILTTILIIWSCLQAFAVQPNFPTLGGTPVICNFGFKTVATPTFIIDAITKVDPSDYLPEGAIGFELRAASGSFVIGDTDNIATGTAVQRVGRLVSEGQSYSWDACAGTFNGSILGTTASVTIKIDAAWGWWEE